MRLSQVVFDIYQNPEEVVSNANEGMNLTAIVRAS